MDIKERILLAYDKIRRYAPQHKWVLCGSASMLLQGIEFGRPLHDIDVYIANDRTNEYLKYKRLFNFTRHDYGLKLDVLYCFYPDKNDFCVMDFGDIKDVIMTFPQDEIKTKERYISITKYEEKIKKHTHDIEIIKSKIGEWTSRNA